MNKDINLAQLAKLLERNKIIFIEKKDDIKKTMVICCATPKDILKFMQEKF